MNRHFEQVAKAVKVLNKKAGGLYGHIGEFVLDVAIVIDANGVVGQLPEGTDIKPLFVEQERQAEAELKVKFGKDAPSTYRVVKALFINCVAAGVPITDAKGKLRGKSDLEEALAATKVPKATIDKFKTTMTTASNLADMLPAHDMLVAAALVQDLMNKLAPALRVAA